MINFVTSLSILRATLITPLLKLRKTRVVNFVNKISMTKVSMLWGQFINNSVTHNAYM